MKCNVSHFHFLTTHDTLPPTVALELLGWNSSIWLSGFVPHYDTIVLIDDNVQKIELATATEQYK